MRIAYIIGGAILGLLTWGFGSGFLFSILGGAIIGGLLARQDLLHRRIEELTTALQPPTVPPERPSAAQPAPTARPPHAARHAADAAPGPRRPEPAATSPPPVRRPPTPPAPPPKPTPPGAPAQPYARPAPAEPTPLDRAFSAIRDWITTGNVPAKVGVIVSFVGVSFLLKYAVERALFVVPIELRLLAVALAGTACLALGWRLRRRMRVYGLSLQGCGIGVLFLTIFAALRVWQVLPAPGAFALLTGLAACTAALAVLQDARSLAVLGIVGGFLAPVLTSTGQGSHVALFSYYLILNGAILGIAWRRAWRELNLIGFWFTFAIAAAWGYRYFQPPLFATTEPFLVLFFLFYQAIVLLYALRQPPERLGLVDGTLMFGTPVLTFALQSQLLRGSSHGLAISAAVLALFYAAVATGVARRRNPALRLVTESFTALAVAFTTLAIPLALDARWTSASWALEGAALIWTGVRQTRHLASLAGGVLLLFSGAAFALAGWRAETGLPVLNGNVLGGTLIALSSFFAARQLGRSGTPALAATYRAAAGLAFAWGALWWGWTGWMEIQDRLPAPYRLAALAAYAAASACAALWIGRRLAWPMLRAATSALLPGFALLALYQWQLHGHWLQGAGALAWPALIAAQTLALRDLDARASRHAETWHIATLLLVTAMLAAEAHWWTALAASRDWAAAAASAMPGAVALVLWRWRAWPAWPIATHRNAYLCASLFLLSLQWASLIALSALLPGDPSPLPYRPLLNPFDLAGLCALLTGALGLAVARADVRRGAAPLFSELTSALHVLAAPAVLALSSLALVRGIHYISAIPWTFSALFHAVQVQTALSIWWALLGVAGMVTGAHRQQRTTWLAGAGLMTLVVLKLFLIDLGNTGTLARIISFIGTGLLLLIVGYLAPAPPRPVTPADRDHPPEPPPHDD